MPTDPLRLEGGCHCGAVRYALALEAPPEQTRALDCNCSICTKKGFVHLIVPQDRFELLAGEDALTTYRFGTGVARHTFCAHCGIHPFYTPRSHPDQVDVNLRTLDEGAWVRFPIAPFDGSEWEANIEQIR